MPQQDGIVHRHNLKALLSPDFIGSTIVVIGLAALLIGLVLTQPLQDILSKGMLLFIGLLIASIVFLLRIFTLPLLRETLQVPPTS
jgi:Na+/melibiose symporter-like transporter